MPNPPDYNPEMWPVPQPDSGGAGTVGEEGGTAIGGDVGPRDLSTETRQTLADYLSAITHADATASPNPGSRNYFAIEPDLIDAASPYDTPDGTPTIVTGGPEGTVDKKFVDLVDERARVYLDTVSNSGRFDETPGPKLQEIVPKTSRGTGHELLAGVKGNDPGSGKSGKSVISDPADSTAVQGKISSILQLNRFSNSLDTPYIEGGEYSDPTIKTTGDFGVYDPNASGHPLSELRKIGASLIFAATGHTGFVSGFEIPANIEQVLPSPAQLMIMKVGTDRLRARVTEGGIGGGLGGADGAPEWGAKLTDSDLRNDAYMGIDIPFVGTVSPSIDEQTSYGQLNSHVEPFSAGSFVAYPFGMAGLAVVGSVAVIAASIAYNLLLQQIRHADGGAVAPATDVGRPRSPASMVKGQYVREDQYQRLLTDLGVPRTDFNFEACIAKGIRTFLGFPTVEMQQETLFTLIATLTPAAFVDAKLIYGAPGFYAGIVRAALRDALEIASLAGAVATGIGLGAIGIGERGIIYPLSIVFKSSTWNFLMVMAQMGNSALFGESYKFSPSGKPIDMIEDGPGTRQAKSRVSPIGATTSVSQLAWRHNALPSRYLLPTSLITAASQYGMGPAANINAGSFVQLSGKMVGYDALATADDDLGKPEAAALNAMTGLRLSADYVQMIENELEAEYVPFYIQDLRTNEILAFNAFIESIKDSYSADYSATSGYGRIDDIMVYKKTKRKMSVNFILAATSEQDFDCMWYDINKLTTLMYPQWSKGKPMVAGDDKFIMPFSQIPTASPMCRLRIGDVVRSNYSKFNLARLFGCGLPSGGDNPEYNIGAGESTSWDCDGESFGSDGEATAHSAARSTQERVRRETDPRGEDDSVGYSVDQNAFLKPGRYTSTDTPDAPPNTHITSRAYGLRTQARAQCKIASRVGIPIPGSPGYGATQVYIVNLTELGYPMDPYAPDHIHNITCTHEDLEIDLSDISFPVTTETSSPTSAVDFYADDKNPIVRSFRSTMGRGLAGFIESLDLDYADSTWETELGSRAPKFIKISISYAPIHDIPPGLDASGFNRAPLYNVGKIMNGISGDPWGTLDPLDPSNPIVQSYIREKAKLGAVGDETMPAGGSAGSG